jgi:formylglycine-generating enzyme required for sulfatase activity
MKARPALSDPLVAELESARRFLEEAIAPIPSDLWERQVTAAYSPIGWHLGHVAAIQARWLLPGEEHRFDRLFDPTATAKAARVQLPPPDQLRGWLDEVYERVCAGLRAGRVPAILGLPETFLVQNIAQHELQHAEHIQVIVALSEGRLHRMPPPLHVRAADRLECAGGRVLVGSADEARAYDNERPQHELELLPYWLDRAPVTACEFARFVEAGGYQEQRHWTEDGWAWRVHHDIRAPLAFHEQLPDAPATCLSWYEADAYARWRGARLPTEFELEAARIDPAGVWEWTSSWFLPYPGFRPYPYEGYSVPWFRTHRVLRSASWATAPALVRPTLRNWYDAGFREAPSGFRCAGGL